MRHSPSLAAAARRLLAALTLALSAGAPASAVLIKSGDGTGNTTKASLPEDPGWDYVGLRSGLSAVYLGNGWVVTANHVLAGEVILDGTPYPLVPGSKIQIGTADLAVFQIDPAPAWPLLPINSIADLTDEPVVMIGQAFDRGTSTSASTFDPSGPTCGPPTKSGWLWDLTNKTKRWGENEIDTYFTGATEGFYTVFDQSGATHEAQATNGDSGGAVFVKNGSVWELAGIMLAIGGCQGSSAIYSDVTYIADLAAYRDQILPIVRPECADELDNDGDFLFDYPDDPDCSSEFDDQEMSKVPTVTPPGLGLLAGLMLGAALAVRRRRRH